MIWLKYRHKFAYGPESYIWMDISGLVEVGESKEDLKKSNLEDCVLGDIKSEYEWSDKYRGIDYELFDAPPIEVIKSKLEDAQSEIMVYSGVCEVYESYIQRYNQEKDARS